MTQVSRGNRPGVALPIRIHELLLGLAGRLDDDALADARQMLASAEMDRALEFVAGCLVAGGVVLPGPQHRELEELYANTHLDPSVVDRVPARDDLPAYRHRFAVGPVDGHEPDRGVAEAIRPVLDVLPDVRSVWCVWRLTPSGPVSGPVPHRIVLVGVGPGGFAPATAYRVEYALRRAGIRASVEVLVDGAQPTAYHQEAMRCARQVPFDDPGPGGGGGLPSVSPAEPVRAESFTAAHASVAPASAPASASSPASSPASVRSAAPARSEGPANPAASARSAVPAPSEASAEPATRAEPATLAEPAVPVESAVPAESAAFEQSDVPAGSSALAEPSTSAEPVALAEPAAPVRPAAFVRPEAPVRPAAPAQPEVPSASSPPAGSDPAPAQEPVSASTPSPAPTSVASPAPVEPEPAPAAEPAAVLPSPFGVEPPRLDAVRAVPPTPAEPPGDEVTPEPRRRSRPRSVESIKSVFELERGDDQPRDQPRDHPSDQPTDRSAGERGAEPPVQPPSALSIETPTNSRPSPRRRASRARDDEPPPRPRLVPPAPPAPTDADKHSAAFVDDMLNTQERNLLRELQDELARREKQDNQGPWRSGRHGKPGTPFDPPAKNGPMVVNGVPPHPESRGRGSA